jgi:hypothetical protein
MVVVVTFEYSADGVFVYFDRETWPTFVPLAKPAAPSLPSHPPTAQCFNQLSGLCPTSKQRVWAKPLTTRYALSGLVLLPKPVAGLSHRHVNDHVISYLLVV